MTSSLSNLVNNLSRGIHKTKCNYGHDDKQCETCRIKHKYCNCFREYINCKNDLIEHKCLCCNNNFQQKFHKKLKERFFDKYNFSNNDKNKFILLLQKGFYFY